MKFHDFYFFQILPYFLEMSSSKVKKCVVSLQLYIQSAYTLGKTSDVPFKVEKYKPAFKLSMEHH